LLSGLVTTNRARRADHAILEAIATARKITTNHARRLMVHGEPVHHSLRLLESMALDISSLLATEVTAIKWQKEEINSKVSSIFGMHRRALRNLEGRLADLHCITSLWGEVRDLLSPGIHAFNGVRSDLAALSEHQTGYEAAHLHVPAGQLNQIFKGWVRRLEARRVLVPAQMP
jgi:hypothetical protein